MGLNSLPFIPCLQDGFELFALYSCPQNGFELFALYSCPQDGFELCPSRYSQVLSCYKDIIAMEEQKKVAPEATFSSRTGESFSACAAAYPELLLMPREEAGRNQTESH